MLNKLKLLCIIIFVFIAGFLSKDHIDNYLIRYLDKTNINNYSISYCFTPPGHHCGQQIADYIAAAKYSIRLQAYGLTFKPIINEIIAAKKRGLTVTVLLDKSNLTTKYSAIESLIANNIDIKIDKVSGIAHNKIIILDDHLVITGSFNFTNSADSRNVENVVFIDDIASAKLYIDNFNQRYKLSKNINQLTK